MCRCPRVRRGCGSGPCRPGWSPARCGSRFPTRPRPARPAVRASAAPHSGRTAAQPDPRGRRLCLLGELGRTNPEAERLSSREPGQRAGRDETGWHRLPLRGRRVDGRAHTRRVAGAPAVGRAVLAGSQDVQRRGLVECVCERDRDRRAEQERGRPSRHRAGVGLEQGRCRDLAGVVAALLHRNPDAFRRAGHDPRPAVADRQDALR